MAALIKDSGEVVSASFAVQAKGMSRFYEAMDKPKDPPKKLVELMAHRKKPKDD